MQVEEGRKPQCVANVLHTYLREKGWERESLCKLFIVAISVCTFTWGGTTAVASARYVLEDTGKQTWKRIATVFFVLCMHVFFQAQQST